MCAGEGYALAVIIPCWNCEAYIGEMLDCLLNQTFTDWKAFLVDDGCIDGTAAIINDYALKDARINYVPRNRGPKGAQTCRNIGFELAEDAKYVVFFDADDLIAPNCLQQRVEYLEKHDRLDFAVFPMKSFRENVYDEKCMVWGIKHIDDDIQAFLNWNLPFVVVTNIYRRQSLVDCGLQWDEKLLSLQDSDFNIQAIVKGLHYEYANGKVDYFYRIVDDGVAKKIRTKQHYDSHVYMLNKTLDSVSMFSDAYDFYLKNHVLLFMDLMKRDKSHLRQVIKLSWVQMHVWFRFKLLMLVLLNFRGKKHLFREETEYSRQLSKCWTESMKENGERLCFGC